MHARSYPVVHRFLKVEEPQLMSPNEPMPPRKNFDEEEWLQVDHLSKVETFLSLLIFLIIPNTLPILIYTFN